MLLNFCCEIFFFLWRLDFVTVVCFDGVVVDVFGIKSDFVADTDEGEKVTLAFLSMFFLFRDVLFFIVGVWVRGDGVKVMGEFERTVFRGLAVCIFFFLSHFFTDFLLSWNVSCFACLTETQFFWSLWNLICLDFELLCLFLCDDFISSFLLWWVMSLLSLFTFVELYGVEFFNTATGASWNDVHLHLTIKSIRKSIRDPNTLSSGAQVQIPPAACHYIAVNILKVKSNIYSKKR